MRSLARVCLVFFAVMMSTGVVQAQLRPGTVRGGIDVDLFSAGAVRIRDDGAPSHTVTRVFSIGPNQLGAGQLLPPPMTPVGLSADYVLRPRWMLGARVGFGYDRLKTEGDSQRALSISLMPSLTFVSGDGATKPFVRFSPIAQFTQYKLAGERQHMFMGCFSLGGGLMMFASEKASAELGLYFEGRFGDYKGVAGGGKADVDDLRGLLRLGVSLWS